MKTIEEIAQIIGGSEEEIYARQKSDKTIELGDLLVSDLESGGYVILKVHNLEYGAQMNRKNLELIAGMKLEGYGADLEFMEKNLRSYVIAAMRGVAYVHGDQVGIPKILPNFFSTARHATRDDLQFLTKPEKPVYLGKVRSGTKIMDVDVYLDAVDAFSHHILIPATTGRGKSNLVKVMIGSILEADYCAALVLDPHDEYYGRTGKGLKDLPKAKEKLLYFSPSPQPGSFTLTVNLASISPWHFTGIVNWTDAQEDAITLFNRQHRENWIEAIVRGEQIEGVAPRTLAVLRRRMNAILGVFLDEKGEFQCRGNVFSNSRGESTIIDMVDALEQGIKIIIDTSRLSDDAELLIGSIVVNEILTRYKHYKTIGELAEKPVVTVVLEEAPRVIGSGALAAGSNIYATIAREGRKFKIGLTAITQLTSEIPRTILANMNTKIILGNEMGIERRAILESAPQDLSKDSRTIAGLDKGEAIVSSTFTRFAIPIMIPLFEEYLQQFQNDIKPGKTTFIG